MNARYTSFDSLELLEARLNKAENRRADTDVFLGPKLMVFASRPRNKLSNNRSDVGSECVSRNLIVSWKFLTVLTMTDSSENHVALERNRKLR